MEGAQPTVSHHIKSLEQELGVELFVRVGSGLKLTDARRPLMSQASKLVREANADHLRQIFARVGL
jgi:DNA-binding transcriptional LysR family regulator